MFQTNRLFYKILLITLISGKNVQVDLEQMKDLVRLALGCAVSVSIFNEIAKYIKQRILIILVTLSCGGSSSENNTYIVQSSTTTAPATPCTYKICPCSTDICRIRYDFTTNVLANQVTSSADAASGTAPDLTTS